MSDFVPATARQLFYLSFLAERLHRTIPTGLTKHAASTTIENWIKAADNPDAIETEWEAHKTRFFLSSPDFDYLDSQLDDWREFYHLRKIPASVVRDAISVIGGKSPEEKPSAFYDRLLKYIAKTRPELTTS